MLFTSAWAEPVLAPYGPQFLDCEFGPSRDVNRFAELAHAPSPVSTLDEATHGRHEDSPRFRDILAPIGLGDELRVALRVQGTTWGVGLLVATALAELAAHELRELPHYDRYELSLPDHSALSETDQSCPPASSEWGRSRRSW